MSEINLKAIDQLFTIVEPMAKQLIELGVAARLAIEYLDKIHDLLEGDDVSGTRTMYLRRLKRCEATIRTVAELGDDDPNP